MVRLPSDLYRRIRSTASNVRAVDRRFAGRTIRRNVAVVARSRALTEASHRLSRLNVGLEMADRLSDMMSRRPTPASVARMRLILRRKRYTFSVQRNPLDDLDTILKIRFNINPSVGPR